MHRLIVVLLACSFTGLSYGADPLQQCRAVADAATRLLCYDALADNAAGLHPTSPVSPAQPASPAVSAAAPTVATRDEALFGTSGETIESAIADLNVQVKTVAQDQRQKLLLTMSNGQRWVQLDQAFLKVSSGDQCVISSGIFGSYTMKCQQGRKAIKVKRLQ